MYGEEIQLGKHTSSFGVELGQQHFRNPCSRIGSIHNEPQQPYLSTSLFTSPVDHWTTADVEEHFPTHCGDSVCLSRPNARARRQLLPRSWRQFQIPHAIATTIDLELSGILPCKRPRTGYPDFRNHQPGRISDESIRGARLVCCIHRYRDS